MNAHWATKIVTPAAAEPVYLDDLKAHLRVTVDDDDDLISSYLSAARRVAEQWSRQTLMPTQYLLTVDRFPLVPNSQFAPGNPSVLTPVLQNTWPLDPSIWAIFLPHNPVISIDQFRYVDITNGLTTLDPSEYQLDSVSTPGRISNIVGSFWPSIAFVPSAVQITFTAGYASIAEIPASLILAIKMLTRLYYDNPAWQGTKELADAPPAIRALIESECIDYFW